MAQGDVEGIEGVDLSDVSLHDAPQRAYLLLVLTDLGAVGGLCLLESLYKLAHLLLLHCQGVVDGGVVGADGVVVVPEGDEFRGEVGLLAVEGADQFRLVYQNTRKDGQKQSGYHREGDCQAAHRAGIFLLSVFLSIFALELEHLFIKFFVFHTLFRYNTCKNN